MDISKMQNEAYQEVGTKCVIGIKHICNLQNLLYSSDILQNFVAIDVKLLTMRSILLWLLDF